MNVKLLKKIQQAIIKRPENFDMTDWFQSVPETQAICGTTACIAGWAVSIEMSKYKGQRIKDIDLPKGRYNVPSWMYESKAMELLALTPLQAKHLFFACYWPPQFRIAYSNADSNKARAIVARDRIDHFIKTEGNEQ